MSKHLVARLTEEERKERKRIAQKKTNDLNGKKYTEKYIKAHPERRLFTSARQRAKLRGIEFSLSIDDIVIPSHCPILGIELKMYINSGAKGGRFDSMSLDRIDNSKGYVKGNVQVISHLANSMKSTASKDQLISFAKWIFSEHLPNEAFSPARLSG